MARCLECIDHPGWSEKRFENGGGTTKDYCPACLGSGRHQTQSFRSPGHRRSYPDIVVQHAELREELAGLGYVLNVNDNDTGEGSLVEIWLDPVGVNTTARANFRLLPEDAIRLAEMLICAAERIEQ